MTVTISGGSFVGAVLTSYQFTDRASGNVYVDPGVATNYNCTTQTGYLDSVPAGTPTNTIAYYNTAAPLTSLTATFTVAPFPESFTLKWFVLPSASTPVQWYGPFPQVVNAHNPANVG